MKFVSTDLPGVMIAEPQVFRDERGFLMETWQANKFAEAGIRETFVQDNHSRSGRGVLRGMHLQLRHSQGKLVRVVSGVILMSPWICAPIQRISVNGPGIFFQKGTSVKCGFPKVSRMVFTSFLR